MNQELACLRSQSVISNTQGRGGRQRRNWVFTEQSVAPLSGVPRSQTAVRVNIEIMRVFVRLRRAALVSEQVMALVEDLSKRAATYSAWAGPESMRSRDKVALPSIRARTMVSLMLISTSREKLINAIVFFSANTKHCGKVKLFKLLYLLDFAHFKETGRSVTGLDYRAWKMGPVPLELMQEWDQLEPDMSAAISIEPEKVVDYVREQVIPRRPFDDSLFTKRELRLMQALAEKHRDEMSKPLVGLTHEERGPWDKIWDAGRGNNARIPYSLAIDDNDPNRDAILAAAREYESIVSAAAKRH